MRDLLDELNRVRGIGGCLLVSPDGLIMESALRQGTDEQLLSAAVGHLLGQGQRLIQALQLGRFEHFTAHSEQGGLLLFASGNAILVILVDPKANLALLRLEVKPFLERIASRLSL
jgi:predicted regulator of Ras-like GTPase activity (Roadblock/LC7/MglB family)